MDVASILQSQDILQNDDDFDFDNPINTNGVIKEPWLTKWTCDEVSICETSWDSPTSLGTNVTLHNVPEYFVIEDFSFPLSEILTLRGINVLMNKAMQQLNEIPNNSSAVSLSSYIQILSFMEFIASCKGVPEDVISLLAEKLDRIQKRVRVCEVSDPVLKKNPNFHVAIFSWKTSVIVFSKLLELRSNSQEDEIVIKLRSLILEIAECLVRMHLKWGTVLSCECCKKLITQLLHVHTHLFSPYFHELFEQSISGTTELSETRLCVNYKVSPVHYFKFYCDCYSFLLSKKAFGVDGDSSNKFIFRIFCMAEKISAKKLIAVCEILTCILETWRPKSLDKQKRATKQIWLQIAQYLENNQIPHLEHLSKSNASSWAHEILYSFTQCESNDVVIFRFISIMFSEKAIWDVSRNIVCNSLNRIKGSDRPLGSLLTLALTIFAHCTDPTEFGNRLCDLLTEMCSGKESLQFEIFFNALDVLTSIAETKNISIKSENVLRKIFDGIPLPSHGSLFVNRLSLYSNHRIISSVDLTRPGKLLNDDDFVRFIILLFKLDLSISEPQMKRCLDFIVSKQNSGSVAELTELFIQRLRHGLQNNTSMFNLLLIKIIEIILSPDTHPDFIFSMTNKILAPPRVLRYLDPFVPCWFLAACRFKETHEADLIQMQKCLWPHIQETLKMKDVDVKSNDPFQYFLIIFQELEKSESNKTISTTDSVKQWLTSSLIKGLLEFLESGNMGEPKFRNALRFTYMLLSHITKTLGEMTSASSITHSIFGKLMVGITQKKIQKIYQPPLPPPVSQFIMKLVNNLLKVPYELFVHARLRFLCVQLQNTEFTQKIIQALRENENTAAYKKLSSDSSPEIRAILAKYS